MENVDKLLWDYIDGQLDKKEQAEVQRILASDPLIAAAYEKQLLLHTELKNLPLEKAPDFIVSNVLVGIKDLSIKRLQVASFNGFKYLAFGFIALTALLLGIAISYGPVTSESVWSTKMSDFFAPLSSFSLPNSNLYLYLSVTVILLVVFWIDFYLNSAARLKPKVLML